MLGTEVIVLRFLDVIDPCTVVIVLQLFFLGFEFWDWKQNSILYMWEVVFQNISIQGGIVHPNVHILFDGPSHAVLLPAYNLEVFQ